MQLLPQEHCAAFEFRNDTWFDDDVYAALKQARAALCLSEREDNAPPPLVETAAWGYIRLRLETYSDDDLRQWARRLEATAWREIAAMPELAALYAELKSANRTLWQIEDEIRERERAAVFDEGFVELARNVYRTNDRRAILKRRINELTGSDLVEEKSYV